MQTLTIIQPDDMHLHLRDGEALKAVLPFTARQMGRAVIMPNLKPPVASVADALAYRARIEAALPEGSTFEPLMTLYLTDNTTPDTVREAKAAGIVAFKLYPAGATTNSDSGVTDLFKLIPVLQTMAQEGILFLVHGEVTDPEIDIFDREAVFIERVMKPVLEKVPALKVVFEHITTADAARLVMEAGENVAASVTPQHLLLNRNDLLVGGVRPAEKHINFSWAPTARHTRNQPKKTPAVARACSAPPPRLNFMQKCLKQPVRSTSSKPLPRKTAPAFTACPKTRARLRW